MLAFIVKKLYSVLVRKPALEPQNFYLQKHKNKILFANLKTHNFKCKNHKNNRSQFADLKSNYLLKVQLSTSVSCNETILIVIVRFPA